MDDKLALEVHQDFERHSNRRHNFESHWQEIAEIMVPSHYDQFNAHSQHESKGRKRMEHIYDSTAVIALQRFSSIMESLLTPRNSRWHGMRADNDDLNKIRRVNAWFEEVTNLLFKYRYVAKANFCANNQQLFKSLGAYGTGSVYIDDIGGGSFGTRYKSVHLSELHLVENHQGLVDKVFRYFKMTVNQAYEKWGEELPDIIKTKVATAPQEEVFFIHRVQPNKNKDPERVDAAGMEYESVYISVLGKKTLETGGYNVFPYPTSRYEQSPGEAYGRSPAMEILPAVKTLNEQKKTVLKQGHRTVDPVLLAHDDGVIDTFNLTPGALNAGGVSAEGRALIHTLPVGNIAIGKDLMDDERAVINDAFLITLFQILTENPQMTATEVMERTREKGILIAPAVGRQQSEYLARMIEREVDILSRQGALPPMPGELIEAEGEYAITYDSPLSRAQRAEEASGLMRTVTHALEIATNLQDPSVMDHFDWDVIIPEVASIHGVPLKWMKDMKKIQATRMARAENQQAQEDIQAAPGEAALMKAQNEVEKTA